MASAAQQAKQFWNHPAGPKTIHFWAPTFKWGISLANVADFQSPIEKVSVPQQCAVAADWADLDAVLHADQADQLQPGHRELFYGNDGPIPALQGSEPQAKGTGGVKRGTEHD
eukprot:CAMPEP_0197502106 /NCGR_PEP_ID=MMETSP1312-20131121/1328_1 /TAXON_ID=464262 /ORGANISM="Genus nov. species nov., Strain RCC2335" /LENGTH=112 /DNA_ID=CAMNT_0043048275 /DNA_START=62 /DNA_END=399 /DNA_ORIENTATION=+